jgi:xylulokinase
MTHLLGIDLSTTGAKALLIDSEGHVVSSATTPLNLSTPHPLWSEQDPHEWWTATANSIKQALAEANVSGENIAAIGLTGQMHGLVLLDDNGQVLRPAILWNDQRCGARSAMRFAARLTREKLVRSQVNDALTGFTAPKILWVETHEPESLSTAFRHILLPKDYIRYKLTGAISRWTKPTASGTMPLRSSAGRTWSLELLDI